MYQKLKLKSVGRQQYKINKYKSLIELRNKLEYDMKQHMLNLLNSTTKAPYTDKGFFETKMVRRKGWVQIKTKFSSSSKWGRYIKVCKY